MIKPPTTLMPPFFATDLPDETLPDEAAPAAEAAAPDIESLSESGAYPTMTPEGWQVDLAPVLPVLDAYMARSRRFVSPESEFLYPTLFFVTDEPSCFARLSSIADKGGAFIGVGQSVSLTYASWLGASHAYALDLNGHVPFSFVPAYGALLCMARSRLEFLSLVLGVPISESMSMQSEEGDSPWDLFYMISMFGHFNQPFFDAVSSALATAIASRGPLSDNRTIFEAVRGWTSMFREKYEEDIRERKLPLKALWRADEEGRGRLLSSEAAFQRKRRMFMEGRITGVAGDISGNIMLRIAEDMKARSLRARAIYICNADAWIMQEALTEAISYGQFTESNLGRISSFYRGLSGLPLAPDANILSVTAMRYPRAEAASGYLQRSFPANRTDLEAAKASLEFFPLRNVLGLAMLRAQMNKLPIQLANAVGESAAIQMISPRLRDAMSVIKSAFEGRPLPASEAMTLLNNNDSTRRRFEQWELEFLLLNLQDAGVVEAGPSSRLSEEDGR